MLKFLQKHNFYPSIHLAMFIRIVGDDGFSFPASFDVHPRAVNTPVNHSLTYLLASSFGEDLIRAIGAYIVGMTDNLDPLRRARFEELEEFEQSALGGVENMRFAGGKIEIMQHEGLDFAGRHNHSGKAIRVSNRIMEGEIVHGGSIDGIERYPVIQENRKRRMDAIRSGLHHFLMRRISNDDIRRNGPCGERIGHGEGESCLGIDSDTNGILVFTMGKPNGIGSEISRLGSNSPVFAFGQGARETAFFRIGRFVHFGFLVRLGVLVLHGDMGSGKRFSGTHVIGIDIEKEFALFDSLALGSLGLGSAFLLGFAFGSFSFAQPQFLGLSPFLCGRHSRIERLAQEGEKQQ